MPDKTEPETEEKGDVLPAEPKPPVRRVYLDPASPPVRSIVRVVVIALIIVFVAGSVQARVTRTGWALLVTVPLRTKVCPVAVKRFD